MWGCVRGSDLIAALALVLWAGAGLAAPSRVVSMNLCTDQLALLLADRGQIAALSRYAADPQMSVLAPAAEGLPVQDGRAETVYLLAPDLVLASSYTDRAALSMLRRLGVEVAEFPPVTDLDQIPEQIARMGALLGQGPRAAALIADFEARRTALAAHLAARLSGARPRAAIWGANGFATGAAALEGQIVAASGHDNVATELGITGIRRLELERLVLAAPDLLVTGRAWPGHSLAEEILHHPALRALAARGMALAETGAPWVCGTPEVLRAAETLAARHDGPGLKPPDAGPHAGAAR